MKMIDEEREAIGGKTYRFTYLANESLLIISIAGRLHERLHGFIFYRISSIINQMGLEDNWAPDGSARTKVGESFSEGDSCGAPIPIRGADDWMTVVVEAARTQTWPSLHVKKDQWFNDSKGEVLKFLYFILTRSLLIIFLR
jgi:hypothetical protein